MKVDRTKTEQARRDFGSQILQAASVIYASSNSELQNWSKEQCIEVAFDMLSAIDSTIDSMEVQL